MNAKQQQSGLDADRLDYLKKVIEEDISQGKYYGMAIAVGRHGELGLLEAIGHAHVQKKQPLQNQCQTICFASISRNCGYSRTSMESTFPSPSRSNP